jgi:hypothetical protein
MPILPEVFEFDQLSSKLDRRLADGAKKVVPVNGFE